MGLMVVAVVDSYCCAEWAWICVMPPVTIIPSFLSLKQDRALFRAPLLIDHVQFRRQQRQIRRRRAVYGAVCFSCSPPNWQRLCCGACWLTGAGCVPFLRACNPRLQQGVQLGSARLLSHGRLTVLWCANGTAACLPWFVIMQSGGRGAFLCSTAGTEPWAGQEELSELQRARASNVFAPISGWSQVPVLRVGCGGGFTGFSRIPAPHSDILTISDYHWQLSPPAWQTRARTMQAQSGGRVRRANSFFNH